MQVGLKTEMEFFFKPVCAESGAVHMVAANDWKDMLAEMMGNVDDYDVFNVNEVGLFYKCVLDKTMAFKKETCSGGKHNKERILWFW